MAPQNPCKLDNLNPFRAFHPRGGTLYCAAISWAGVESRFPVDRLSSAGAFTKRIIKMFFLRLVQGFPVPYSFFSVTSLQKNIFTKALWG